MHISRAYYNDDSILLPGILIKRFLKRSIFAPCDPECGFDYQYVTEKERIIRYDKKSYAEFYEKTYSPGTSIVLLSPKDGIDLNDPTIQAHVIRVDSFGWIHCQLDDSRTVDLIPGIDSFRIVGNNG